MLFSIACTVILALHTVAYPLPYPKTVNLDTEDEISAALAARQFDWDVTRNDLVNGVCKPVTVIYARGTIELGNVGSVSGPPFFNALDVALGAENVAVQGVNYPATILGYLEGGDQGGAKTAASLLNQAATQCPETQIVLSGYSQGAQVAHLGEAQVSAEVAGKIAAVVLFGDPKKGEPLPNIDSSKVMTFCFAADLICDKLPITDSYHFSYALDAISAADFVKNLVTV